MVKKTTLEDIKEILVSQNAVLEKYGKEIGDLTETMVFVVKNMATKDDIVNLNERVDGLTERVDGLTERVDGLTARVGVLTVKVDGVQNTIDRETIVRSEQKIPERVSAIEKHFGQNRKIIA